MANHEHWVTCTDCGEHYDKRSEYCRCGYLYEKKHTKGKAPATRRPRGKRLRYYNNKMIRDYDGK